MPSTTSVERVQSAWAALRTTIADPHALPSIDVAVGPDGAPAGAPSVVILTRDQPLAMAPLLGPPARAVILAGHPAAARPRPAYPRRDGLPPLPLCVLASARWRPAAHDAARGLGLSCDVQPAWDGRAPPAPLACLLEGQPLRDVEAALHAGAVLICPETLTTFAGAGLVSWRAAGVSLARLLALLAQEPQLRRSIAEAQWTALAAAHDDAALSRHLLAFAHALGVLPPVGPPPLRHVVVEGSIGSSFSLALVNRRLGAALADHGMVAELRSSEGEVGDFDEGDALRALGEPYLSAYRQSGDAMPPAPETAILRLAYPPRSDDFAPTALAAFSAYAWEETEFPRRWAETMNRSLGLVTTLSAHVARCLRAAGYRGPLLVAGCGADHIPPATAAGVAAARALLAPLPRQFTFLHVSSALLRKGIDVLLDAWAELARDPSWTANLVLKTQRNEHNQVAALITARGLDRHRRAPVLDIATDLDPDTMAGLYRATDALVQPTRCEGLGLPMAEAMLAGKPVIATGWSAHAEFCTPDTSWPINFTFVPARSHLSGFLSAWAEPDRRHLTQRLREVRRASAADIARKTQTGQAILRRHYTWQAVARRTAFALSRAREAAVTEACLRPPQLGLVSTWNARCGIADYVAKLVSKIAPSCLVVAANATADRLGEDDTFVQRVWSPGQPGLAEAVLPTLAGCEALCIQFTFGLHDITEMARLLDRAARHGMATIAMLHSTEDRQTPSGIMSLRQIADSLRGADLVCVHTVSDLERLRGFGVVDPVVLFPHGAPGADVQTPLPAAVQHFMDRHDRVLATFGYMLPHKGFAELLSVFPTIRERAAREGRGRLGLLLLNARYPSQSSAEETKRCQALIAAANLSDDVLLVSEHMPEREALAALSRAALIVYPYQRTQESSSAAVRFGLASGAPVATTSLAIFEDVLPVTHRLRASHGETLAASVCDILGQVATASGQAVEIASRQAAWFEAHRWDSVAARFWDIVRGLALDRRLGGPWRSARTTSLWLPDGSDA